MDLSAEISLYPLQTEYIPVIKAFIERLNQYPDLKVETSVMSTQVHGAYDQVMTVIKDELRHSFEQFGVMVLVCKFIPRVPANVDH